MRTIAIINQKGGCGKTTTALNLASLFAQRSLRTLLVDLDPQSHCAAGLAIPDERIDYDIGDAMIAGDRPNSERLLWRISRHLDLAPSRMRLAAMEAARGRLAELERREHRLAMVLEHFREAYDACVIDCSPSIGLLAFNAIVAADGVLIPVETSFFSLRGAQKQVAAIRALARRLGAEIPWWVLPTLYEPDEPHAKDLLAELRRAFGERVAPRPIRRDVTLKEAIAFGKPAVEYAKDAPGCQDYAALGDWLCDELGVGTRSTGTGRPEQVEGDIPMIATSSEASRAFLGQSPDHVEAGVSNPAPPATSPTGPASSAGESSAAPSPSIDRASDIALRAQALRRALLERGGAKVVLDEEKPTPSRSEPAPNVRSILGARSTGTRGVFVYPLSIGRRVEVVGSFNEWQPGRSVCIVNEELGVHELSIPLAPGRYCYRLVIDGSWRIDPYNPVSEPNPFGERNSVLVVRPRAVQQAGGRP